MPHCQALRRPKNVKKDVYLIHKRDSFISCFHQVVLCPDNDFTCEMVEGEEDAADCQPKEGRHA
jgi:hypothetical protein